MDKLLNDFAILIDRHNFLEKRNRELVAENQALRNDLELKLDSSEVVIKIRSLEQQLKQAVIDRRKTEEILQQTKAFIDKNIYAPMFAGNSRKRIELELDLIRYQLKDLIARNNQITEESQYQKLSERQIGLKRSQLFNW